MSINKSFPEQHTKHFSFLRRATVLRPFASGPNVGRIPGGNFFLMKIKFAAVAVFANVPLLYSQDPKSGAEDMKYSRDVYSKVHMVAIAKLTFEAPPAAEFQYDRYPNGGAERIKSGEGKDFARKDGKTWLVSDDWGETGGPVDPGTAKRLNNWISVIDSQLKSDAPLKFVRMEDAGERDEFVFEETGKTKGKGKAPRWSFGKYKNATNDKSMVT